MQRTSDGHPVHTRGRPAPHDMARTPAMCLPGGFDEYGLPMGFQIVGPQFGEERLLQAEHACHSRIPTRALFDLIESLFSIGCICDSRCGLVKEASLHDATPFE